MELNTEPQTDVSPTREIAVGDVVKLNSGGEMMTVREVKDGEAVCLFFAPPDGLGYGLGPASKTLQSFRLPVACLRVV